MPALRKTKKQQAAIEIKKLFHNGLLDKGWTQKHLAELMGRQEGVISKAFNHPFRREFELLYDIADKLGVNLGDALKGGGDRI